MSSIEHSRTSEQWAGEPESMPDCKEKVDGDARFFWATVGAAVGKLDHEVIRRIMNDLLKNTLDIRDVDISYLQDEACRMCGWVPDEEVGYKIVDHIKDTWARILVEEEPLR